MKRDEKRRKFISEQLLRLNLNFTIIDAVEGKALAAEAYRQLVDEVAVAPKSSWLTKGAIGCALSHHKAYTAIAAEDLDYALILEDDCILHPDLPEILHQLPAHLSSNEVILLYYRNRAKIKLKKTAVLAGKYAVCCPDKPSELGSTVAYVITKQVSIQLAESLLPITTTSDHWGNFVQRGLIHKIRCIYPMPVDTADFKSSINYLPEGSLASLLSDFIDKYKVFPFYQLLRYRRKKIKKSLEIREIEE